MCQLVEMTINAGKPDEKVLVEVVECSNPDCPAK